MALPIHSLNRTSSNHVPAPPRSAAHTPRPVQTGAQTPAQTTAPQAPSFSAIFAQTAANAAAAGKTVASFATPTAAPAPPSPVPTATQTATQPATQPAQTVTPVPAVATAVAPAPAAPSTAPAIPAAASSPDGPAGPLFGANPWLADPTGSGPNGTVTHYNPVYFATQQTAQTVAQMLGGTVVQSVQITTAPGSPFQQDQSNYMVQLPNGGLVNPGFIADLYTHGWPQGFINQQIANEVAGAQPAIST